MTAPKNPIKVDELVYVDEERTVWKVTALAKGLADLTKLNSDPRKDWKGVAVKRLARAAGVV